MRNPGIDTVMRWQPPDEHIFHTDPSLLKIRAGVPEVLYIL